MCDGRHAGKDGASGRVKGGDGIARSSIRLFRAILNWGYKQGTVEWEAVLAARNVEIGRDGRRDVILEDPEAYARLWATLDRMVTPDIETPASLLRPVIADAIRLIALCDWLDPVHVHRWLTSCCERVDHVSAETGETVTIWRLRARR